VRAATYLRLTRGLIPDTVLVVHVTTSGQDGGELTPDERARLAAIRSAESLAELAAITGADTEHDAYFAAKREWAELRGRELQSAPPEAGLPGNRVVVDGHAFHVHGVTHADTAEERAFLREHVSQFRDGGATVYCEQGIRSMYFEDFPGVRELDDYRWAIRRCEALDVDSRVSALSGAEFSGVVEEVRSAAAQFREAAFSLIDSGREVYGDEFAAALGDLASYFLMSHEELATAEDFESFRRTREAATDPSKLAALQRYYETVFLPQPLEREWLRRHDRELEVVTHARNERMADYAVYHTDVAGEVHLIVGAAHQPGVTYYLRQHRDGRRDLDGFEPVP